MDFLADDLKVSMSLITWSLSSSSFGLWIGPHDPHPLCLVDVLHSYLAVLPAVSRDLLFGWLDSEPLF